MREKIDKGISDVYFKAMKDALEILFKQHKERFYYLVLAVDENGLPPIFSAWSDEALSLYKNDNDLSDEEAVWAKWSYSESPYLNFQEKFFSEATSLWNSRGLIEDFDGDQWQRELEYRMRSLEDALKKISNHQLIGSAINRDCVMFNVEEVPPSKETTRRAIRLNGMNKILKKWLAEAAE